MTARAGRTVLLALVVAGAGAAPAGAAGQAPRPIVVQTIPAVEGVHMHLGSRRFMTDERGRTTITFTAAAAGRKGFVQLLAPLRVRPKRLADGGIARFERLFPWRGGRRPEARIALSTHYRITPTFVDLKGRPVAPELVDRYSLKSRHGVRLTRRGGRPALLQASRVVRFTGRLVSKQIDWSVEHVMVEGSDVVNRAQQRFKPSRLRGRLPVKLLFYPVTFSAHDAIFGFPVGRGVKVVKPNGTRVRYAFGDGASVHLDRLPRGLYRVTVDARGYSFQRPVALSKSQIVELEVITWLDVAVVVGLLVSVALLLLVARRPALRRRLTRPFRRRRGAAVALATGVVLLVLLVLGAGSALAAPPVNTTKLFAYYYIWFNPSSWNRAKTDYPLLGRYSSDETTIMRQHIEMAKDAGIDGFFVSWKSTPLLDDRLRKLVSVARQEHFKLAIIYQGLDYERRPLPASRVAADLDRLRDRFAKGPVFDAFEKPLVIWSGTWESSLKELRDVTEPRRDDLLILATERTADDYRAKASAFDGDAYYWSSVNPDTFPDYPGKLAGMAAAVHGRAGIWIPPASPGFDARLIGGRTVVPRRGGETLRREMDVAQQSDPDVIGLISWNEFSENSHVEPSRRYGPSALRTIADIRGADLSVGGDLDSSQPTSRGTGPGALTSIVTFLIVLGAGVAVLFVARRRREAAGLKDWAGEDPRWN
jgi:hypothetical protein